jgi:preprotein translocase subunit Sec61beta
MCSANIFVTKGDIAKKYRLEPAGLIAYYEGEESD